MRPSRVKFSSSKCSEVEFNRTLHKPMGSRIFLVRKKDETTRFCVHYRKLNKLTIQDWYPLPDIDESLDTLSGNAWFLTLYLFSAY